MKGMVRGEIVVFAARVGEGKSMFNNRDYRDVINTLEKWEREKTGGLEPIPADKWPQPCTHPGHQPPTHISIPPGMQYRHVCPGCGHEAILRPPQITF